MAGPLYVKGRLLLTNKKNWDFIFNFVAAKIGGRKKLNKTIIFSTFFSSIGVIQKIARFLQDGIKTENKMRIELD